MIDKILYNKIKEYINDNVESYLLKENKLFNATYGKATFQVSEKRSEKYSVEEICSDGAIEEELVRKIKEIDESFSDAIIRIIREKNLDDVEVYKSIDMDRRLFSKIRSDSNYKPSKETAIALCFGLKLNLEESNSLLKKAGYVLSKSSIFDLIIQYFLENNIYDVYEIDEALLAFDQKTLIH